MRGLFVGVFFVIFTDQHFVWAQFECPPINGVKVDCINVRNCESIFKVIRTKQLANDVKKNTRKLLCGYDGNVPKVCCPPLFRENSLLPSPSNQECGLFTEDRLFNDPMVNIDAYPWTVLLGYNKGNSPTAYKCGGVLISKNYVLTAAHCVTGPINDNFGQLTTVRLGEYNTDTDLDCVTVMGDFQDCAYPLQEILVEESIVHPGFSGNGPSLVDDIALVRLSQKANLNEFTRPICLPDSNMSIEDDDILFLVGWGIPDEKNNLKRKLKVPLVDRNYCARAHGLPDGAISDKQICISRYYGEDTCAGDSGGSLMMRNIIHSMGVLSYEKDCGKDGKPSIYTFVPKYRSWILSKLKP